MDIYEISGSYSGVTEATCFLLRCDAVSLGEVFPEVSTKHSLFLFESRAVYEECRTYQTTRRHVPEHLTGQGHRNLASFCAVEMRTAAGLGRFLPSDSGVRRT
jgi:hypothetical protein